MRFTPITGLLLASLPVLAHQAAAQDVFTTGVTIFDSNAAIADLYVIDNTTIGGKLCVGSDCGSTQGYGTETIRIRNDNPRFRFDDSSATGSTRDWTLQTNDADFEFFLIYDNGADTFPFIIDGGAPSRSIQVRSNGNVGIGSSGSATAALTLTRGDTPSVRFEQDGSGGQTPQTWDIIANETNFYVRDHTNNVGPFYIYPGAGNEGALTIAGDGHVGMGTYSPAAQLHVAGDQGQAQLLIEEVNATANPRTLLNLQNNGRPEIVMGNTATNGEWSFGAGTDFFLKTGTVGSTSGAKTKVFTVKQNGDAIVFGTLTTGGTTCGTGCDRVFADDYALPSIADHAADMKRLGHLPNVGPTIEGEPINITDKLGRVLNELEHAHLYIADQEERLAAQGARMAAQDARIARLERLLEAGTE